jgi:hypothetical protein
VSFKQLKQLKTYTHPLSSGYIFWTSVSNTANQIDTVLLDLNKKWIYQTSRNTNTDPLATQASFPRGHKGWKTPHRSTKNSILTHKKTEMCIPKIGHMNWTIHTSVLICIRWRIFNYIYVACSNSHTYNGRKWQDSWKYFNKYTKTHRVYATNTNSIDRDKCRMLAGLKHSKTCCSRCSAMQDSRECSTKNFPTSVEILKHLV